MIRSANGWMPVSNARMTLYRGYVSQSGRVMIGKCTDDEYAAEIALQVVPVVPVINTKDLVLHNVIHC